MSDERRRAHPVLGAGRLGRAARVYSRIELRLGIARQRLPPTAQRALAPLFAVGGTAVRRLAAAPFFVSGSWLQWNELVAGDGLVSTWQPSRARSRLLSWVWPESSPATSAPARRVALRGMLALLDRDRQAALQLVTTSTFWAPLLRRRGFRIVPDSVRWVGRPADLDATLARPGDSLAANLAVARRSAFRTEIWDPTPARRQLFWERYLSPHARARFGDRAHLLDRDLNDRLCRAGRFLVVRRERAELPDAMALMLERAGSVHFVSLGTLDADPDLTRAGAQTALYEAEIRWALGQGFRRVDFGRSLPGKRDGVAWYKWQWGLRPEVDRSQVVETAVRIRDPELPVARRLLAMQLLVREGSRIEIWAG